MARHTNTLLIAARHRRVEVIIINAATVVIELACLGSFVVFVGVAAGFITGAVR